MAFTIEQIAQAIERQTKKKPEARGDLKYVIHSPAPLSDATSNQITFYSDCKYKNQLASSRAGCLIISQKAKDETLEFKGNVMIVENIQLAWLAVLKLFSQNFKTLKMGIDPKANVADGVTFGKDLYVGSYAVIEAGVTIGEGTQIYPHVYIGAQTKIGSYCVIYPRVVIRERCVIGNRVIIQPGAVIGGDGFGYVSVEGRHEKIPQIGTVEIEDDVEIGANATVDRAQIGVTRIGCGTKIDNLVQIAHNVQIGKNCIFAAQAGIAGSSSLGDNVVLGGQAGVRDHVRIASGVIVGGQSGIISDINVKDVLLGSPARNRRKSLVLEAILNKLPEMYEDFKKRKRKDSNSENA